jgi:hypothetical protein
MSEMEKKRKDFINLRKRCSVEVVQVHTNHTFLNHSNTAHCMSPGATFYNTGPELSSAQLLLILDSTKF